MKKKVKLCMWIRKGKWMKRFPVKINLGIIGFGVNLWIGVRVGRGLGGVRVGDKIFADAARCEAVCGSLTYSRPLFHFQYIEIHI